jgi:hypothetical protein
MQASGDLQRRCEGALLVLLAGGVSVWQFVARLRDPSRVISSVQAPALPLPAMPSIAVLSLAVRRKCVCNAYPPKGIYDCSE